MRRRLTSVLLALALLLSLCPVSAFAEGEEPETVEQPEAIEEPEVVEEPKTTEEPEVVEEPKTTEEPEVVEEPKTTEEPEVVEEPKAAEEPEAVEQPLLMAPLLTGSSAGNIVASGACDNGLTWELDDEGTLTIAGTVGMEEYKCPWSEYKNSVNKLVICEGVTGLCVSAFQGYCSLTSITIPASVTSIDRSAFEGCSSLTDISLPESLKSIGPNAFDGCSSLLSITIPASVTSIDGSAFAACEKLTSIMLPASLESIGDAAFSGCENLESITIPASVTSIGDWVFRGCSRLTSISVEANNDYFSVTNGMLLNKAGTELLCCPGGMSGSVTVPSGVTIIVNSAFHSCKGLTSVSIPTSVTSIADYAFCYCSSLTDIYYGGTEEQWNSIDKSDYAQIPVSAVVHFNRCGESLTWALDDEGTLTIAGTGAMTNYDYGGAPWYCDSVKTVVISEGVTSIGSSAFRDCYNLMSITLSASVTSIGGFAFSGCSRLTGISVDANNDYFSVTDGMLLNKAGTELICCPGGKSSVTIPGSVTSIGGWAFAGCGSLTSIEIPDSVTSIGEWAFGGVWSLTSITLPEGVTSIGDDAFYYCGGLTSITIPDSVTSIGDEAFIGCDKLKDIYFGGSEEQWNAIEKSNAQIPDAAELHFTDPQSLTVASGTCGADLKWTLDDAGTLTISGTGAMMEYGYGYGDSPWYDYRSSIKTVSICAGVMSIGDYAFNGCSGLASITIPAGVTSIGWNAFNGCSSLTAITIPDSVTSIGNEAFFYCSSLTSICVDADNSSYCSVDGLLLNKSKTELLCCPGGKSSVTIPGSVTSIGYGAFYSCSSLTSICVDADNSSYCSVNGLLLNKSGTILVCCPEGKSGSVTIPEGVTSIGDGAFYSCSSLTSISIPDSVTSIGNSAFYSCSSLTSIIVDSANGAYCSVDGLLLNKSKTELLCCPGGKSSVTIPEGVTSISQYAFERCDSLMSVTIPSSVASIGDCAFQFCSSLTSVTISEGVTSIGGGAFQKCSNLTSVTIPTSVTSIGYSAFSWCESLTSVIIPAGVTSIDVCSFYNCSSLTSVTIPASVTSIGDEAFIGCSALTDIYYGGTETQWNAVEKSDAKIPASAQIYFALASGTCGENLIWTLDDAGTLTISGTGTMTDYGNGDSPWYDYRSSIKTVSIGAGVTSIGSYAFSFCSGLASITIPASVTSIGNYAFYGCSTLTTITIPAGVTSIGDVAFWCCNGLTSICVDAQNSSYCSEDGMLLSKDCTELICCPQGRSGSVTVPAGVTSISNSAFNNCSRLTSITIPEGVTSISDHTFRDCSSLQSIEIPAGIRTIGTYAFYGCRNLVSATLPEGISRISEGMFGCCTKLSSVNIPDSVTSIDRYAFSCCSSLRSIEIPHGVNVLGDSCFRRCSHLTSVSIPNSVTFINYRAFSDCINLKSVVIPESVTSIGSWSFENCSSLEFIEIPSTVTSIEGGAFSGCKSLKSVVIPEGVTSVGRSAFWDCSSLESIEIPSTVTSIGGGAFSGCRLEELRLSENNTAFCYENNTLFSADRKTLINASVSIAGCYVVPESVTNIEYAAFRDCSGLNRVLFPSSLKKMGISAFSGCVNLESIQIPEGVEYITNSVFEGCTNLRSISIPQSLQSMSMDAFNGTKLRNYDSNIYYAGSEDSWGSINVYNGSGFSSFALVNYNVVYGSLTGTLDWALDESGTLTLTGNGSIPASTAVSSLWGGNEAKIKTVVLPASVSAVGSYAFSDCTNLTVLSLPDGLIVVGEGAFSGCTKLHTVFIPESMETIGANAFSGCETLNTVLFSGSDEAWNSICIEAGNGCLTKVTRVAAECAGVCGENLTWTLDNAGTLTISGTGAMENSGSGVPWEVYKEEITAVIVETGVTALSDDAFSCCTAMRSISLPEGLISIGSYCFLGCFSLTTLWLPDSLEFFGDYAMEGCCSLTFIHLGASLQTDFPSLNNVSPRFSSLQTYDVSVDNPAYSSIDGVLFNRDGTELLCFPCGRDGIYQVPDGVRRIGENAFCRNNLLDEVVLPESVTEIGNYAFCDSSIRKVNLPDSLESLGEYAFAFSRLEYDTIPAGIRNLTGTEFPLKGTSFTVPDRFTELGANSISSQSLQTIRIPATVLRIDSQAFSGSSLRCIEVDENNPNYCSVDGNLYNKDKSQLIIAVSDSENSSGSTVYRVPTSESTFNSYSVPSFVTAFEVDEGSQYYSAVDGILYSKDMTTLVCCPPAKEGEVSIPEGVTSLAGNAFRNCGRVTAVSFPSSLREFGYSVFSGCNSLETLSIPEGVNRIDDYFCSECTRLKSVYLPSTVHDLSVRAFGNCPNLTQIGIAEGNRWFCNYDGVVYNQYMSKLVLCPDGRTGSVTIPEGVTEIGYAAFENCKKLTAVTFPSTLTSMGWYAFMNCSGLKSVSIPSELETISGSAFYGCSSLTQLTLSEGLKTIEYGAFNSCSSLETVLVPVSVINIGTGSFDFCTSLQAFEVEEDNPAFCSVNGVLYNKARTKVIAIPQNISTFTISAEVSELDSYSLSLPLCTAFAVEDGNKAFSVKDGLLYNKAQTVLLACPAGKQGAVTIDANVRSIDGGVFKYATAITSFEVNEDNPYYTSVDGVLYSKNPIVLLACPALQSGTLLIPEGTVRIDGWAFEQCTELGEIRIPASLTFIEEISTYAPFESCGALEAITVDSDNPVYSSVDGVLFNKALTRLIRYPAAKSGAYSIPEGVVGVGSFYNCTKLTSLIVPEGVNWINAFIGCSALTDIYYGGTETQWNAIEKSKAYIPASAQIHFALASGTCGDNLWWMLDDAGTLTISGTGDMYDYTAAEPAPWWGYIAQNNAIELRLEEGMTHIGAYAFANHRISSFRIPSTVQSIGEYAFYNGGLTQLSLNNGLESIGEQAFCGNNLQQNIQLPLSVSTLGKNAFPAGVALDYPGTEDMWNALVTADSKEQVTFLTLSSGILLNSDTLSTGSMDSLDTTATYNVLQQLACTTHITDDIETVLSSSASLSVTLVNFDADTSRNVTSVRFELSPLKGDGTEYSQGELKKGLNGEKITFTLPVPDSMASAGDVIYISHYLDGNAAPITSEPVVVQGEPGALYVEYSADSFSVYELSVLRMETDEDRFGMSLTLDGTIGVNYYVDVDYLLGKDAQEGACIVLKYKSTDGVFRADEPVNLESAKKTSDGQVRVTARVNPSQICDEIYVTVYYDYDTQTQTGTVCMERVYSINDYCNLGIQSNNAKLVALCQALKDYGSSCQTYFKYNTSNLANGGDYGDRLAAVTASDIEAIPKYSFNETNADNECTGVSFMALTKSQVRFYLEKEASEISTSTNSNVEKGRSTANNQNYVAVTNIAAKDLNKPFELTVDGNTYSGCALSYARLVIEKTQDAGLQTLSKALILYNRYAVSYFPD